MNENGNLRSNGQRRHIEEKRIEHRESQRKGKRETDRRGERFVEGMVVVVVVVVVVRKRKKKKRNRVEKPRKGQRGGRKTVLVDACVRRAIVCV